MNSKNQWRNNGNCFQYCKVKKTLKTGRGRTISYFPQLQAAQFEERCFMPEMRREITPDLRFNILYQAGYGETLFSAKHQRSYFQAYIHTLDH